ncbi:MAG: hypothetical protein GXY17_00270 [Clostridiaceae bacterium]|nr:hypothetical protein [Clostridiaceae bacterium]
MKTYMKKTIGILLNMVLVFSLLFGSMIPAEASESEAASTAEYIAVTASEAESEAAASAEYIAVTASEAESEAAASADYIAVDAPKSGNDYLIAYTEGTTAHVIDSEGMATESPGSSNTAGQIELQVGSDIITTDDESLVWTVTSSDSDWLIQPKYGENSGRYLYPGTSKNTLYLSTTDRAWTYSGQKLTYDRDYLRYSESKKGFQYSSSDDKNAITFYELVDPDLTEKPVFSSNNYLMPDTDATTAEFVLTDAYTEPVFKVYADSSDSQTVEGITTTLGDDGITLTLTFEAAPTEDITYYISAIDGDLKESKRTAINVEAYVESYVYTEVSAISSGSTYLIVATDDDNHYAMTTEENTSGYGYLSHNDVTDKVNDDEIILEKPETEGLEWILTDSDSGFTIYNKTEDAYVSLYMNPDESKNTYGLKLNSAGTAWIYDNSDNFIRYIPPEGEQTYTNPAWLYYSSQNDGFRANTDNDKASAITLYQKQEDTVTNSPKFSENSYRMPTEDANTAEFELTTAYTAPVFKVYANNSDSEPADDVTADLGDDGVKLTLTFKTAPTQDTTYYISAKEPDLEESGRTAVKVKIFDGDSSDYLAFTSDVHYGGTNNLSTWLGLLESGDILEEEQLDYMGFCGDMASGNIRGESNYWSSAQTMLDTVTSSKLISSDTNRFIYTAGNHEYLQGNYGSTDNATAKEITRLGEAAKTDNYIIYCFGAAGSSQSFTSYDIDALEDYLGTAPDDIPIIILSHFPIHHFSSRTTSNAIDLINMLNEEHENVIFLWGHNHTLADTNYGEICTAGSSINYTSSKSAQINFTYAAAGCMSDSEYSSSGSGSVKEKGMIMEIADGGGTVIMTYYGLDGEATGAATTIKISEPVPSSDAELSSLSYSLNGSVGKSCPGFSPSIFGYLVTLPYGTPDGNQLTLSGVCSDKDADITGNMGATVCNGMATAYITVTAEDGFTTRTYAVNFTVSTIPDTPRYPIRLAFTSDTHYESGKTNNLDGWLNDMSTIYDALDYVGITGDIGSTASTSVNQYWQFVQEIIDTVDDHSDLVTKGGIYTTGNHEQYAGPGAGGDYENQRNSNPTAKRLIQSGVAASTEDYVVYCFGASNDGSSRLVQEFTEQQIEQLESFLNSENANSNIPVFIMSHYPLHYNGNRIVERSEEVIAILNEHPNVFFLWGHNHSDVGDMEVGYDNILKAGDTITTLNNENGTPSTKQIQFTYTAAGCMSDGEYYSSSAAVLGKGIVAEITDIAGQKQVSLTYYNLDGESFSVEGKNTVAAVTLSKPEIKTYTISWDTDGDGIADDTTTVAYGTMPAHANGKKNSTKDYTYSFTGWSPALTPVTGAATYTAKFLAVPVVTPGGGVGGGGVPSGGTDEKDPSTEDIQDNVVPSGSADSENVDKKIIYDDVPGNSWYYDAVQYVTEFGLFQGVSNKRFEPDTTITRAMFVTALWRLEGKPAPESSNRFADVAHGAWYTDAVTWASANDIVKGYSPNSFGPNDILTREQLATILYRYAIYKGYDVTAENDLTAFHDASKISFWALTEAKWAVAEGLITGVSETSFDPAGKASRAQVAMILMRFVLNKVK